MKAKIFNKLRANFFSFFSNKKARIFSKQPKSQPVRKELNKEKHRNLTYHSKNTINKTISDPHFVHLDEIISDLYEVKSLKRNIPHDLSIQID